MPYKQPKTITISDDTWQKLLQLKESKILSWDKLIELMISDIEAHAPDEPDGVLLIGEPVAQAQMK